MSYEGYTQHLCLNGHQWFANAYAENDECPYCSENSIWQHEIDETNGTDEEDQNTFEIKLDVYQKEKYSVCQCCGNETITEQIRYWIPFEFKSKNGTILQLKVVRNGDWELEDYSFCDHDLEYLEECRDFEEAIAELYSKQIEEALNQFFKIL